jgi:hypothetical protein
MIASGRAEEESRTQIKFLDTQPPGQVASNCRENASRVESDLQFAGLDFVDITPNPRFSGLDGTDQRVMIFMKMFGGVLVFRGVAAPNLAACQAKSKMYPGIACFDALLANMFGGLFDLDLVEMAAFARHRFLQWA